MAASVSASDWSVKGATCSADFALFVAPRARAGSRCECTHTQRDCGRGLSREEGSDAIGCSHVTCRWAGGTCELGR